MLKKYLSEAEKDIEIIQFDADKKIAERKAAALEFTVELFSSIGWNKWTKEQLLSSGQYERCLRGLEGKKMSILSVDGNSGIIRGSDDYSVSENGCSCGDFWQRGLPCKHMYYFIANKDSFYAPKNIVDEDTREVSAHSSLSERMLNDKCIVVSGTFTDYTREEISKIIIGAGGRISGSVSKRTDYLVVGTDPGTKLTRAQELGVEIITETQLLGMIDNR